MPFFFLNFKNVKLSLMLASDSVYRYFPGKGLSEVLKGKKILLSISIQVNLKGQKQDTLMEFYLAPFLYFIF